VFEVLREDDGNGGNAAESYGIKIDDRFVYSFLLTVGIIH
jgi:hypothetical protein